jgi:hypothetical protein
MKQNDIVIEAQQVRPGDQIYNTLAVKLQGVVREAFSWMTVRDVGYRDATAHSCPMIEIVTSAWSTYMNPRDGVLIRRWETETPEEAKRQQGVLAAPCDYGSYVSHLLSFLEDEGYKVRQLHDWELSDGKTDDGEDLPADLVEEWKGKDCAAIVWIGYPETMHVPRPRLLLEKALAGECVPTDT